MGKKSRTKGHSFERECAIDLRPIFPKAARHLEYQDGEAFGVDLKNTGKYKFQCKFKKKYVSINTIREIQLPDVTTDVPVLITRGNGLQTMAVLPWENFLQLLYDAERK